MSYIIRSKTTGDFFRWQLGESLRWTDHALLAAKYETACEAARAATDMHISAGTVEIAQIQDGSVVALNHMQDTRPRAYLGGGRDA
jgi:hypothetical protein